MSRQAQAERERQVASFWHCGDEISASSRKLQGLYQQPVALHLRAMNMLYEAIKEKANGDCPLLSSGNNGLGGMLGLRHIHQKQ